MFFDVSWQEINMYFFKKYFNEVLDSKQRTYFTSCLISFLIETSKEKLIYKRTLHYISLSYKSSLILIRFIFIVSGHTA